MDALQRLQRKVETALQSTWQDRKHFVLLTGQMRGLRNVRFRTCTALLEEPTWDANLKFTRTTGPELAKALNSVRAHLTSFRRSNARRSVSFRHTRDGRLLGAAELDWDGISSASGDLARETRGVRAALQQHCKSKFRGGAPSVYYPYMARSRFCVCPAGLAPWSPRPVEAVLMGCIPVILSDDYVLPLQEFIAWPRLSIRVQERDIPRLVPLLRAVEQNHTRIAAMLNELHWAATFLMWREDPNSTALARETRCTESDLWHDKTKAQQAPGTAAVLGRNASYNESGGAEDVDMDFEDDVAVYTRWNSTGPSAAAVDFFYRYVARTRSIRMFDSPLPSSSTSPGWCVARDLLFADSLDLAMESILAEWRLRQSVRSDNAAVS